MTCNFSHCECIEGIAIKVKVSCILILLAFSSNAELLQSIEAYRKLAKEEP